MTDLAAPALAWRLDAELGEGPVWIEADRALWFVDIVRGRLHRYDPATGDKRIIETGGSPSFVAALADGDLLVGDGHRLMRFADSAFGEAIATLKMAANNRTNDATVDAGGRLWFGTMDRDTHRPTGHFHCFDGGSIRDFGEAIAITNGPAVSPDGQWLYTVNTLGRIIRRHRLNDDGIDAGTTFVTIDPAKGTPDGVSTDAEGCVWLAVWGGGCIQRYSPDGVLLLELPLPCTNVTKVAFGGPDLRTGFVTTARIELDPATLAREPLAGSLFTFAAPAPGHPVPPVRLAR